MAAKRGVPTIATLSDSRAWRPLCGLLAGCVLLTSGGGLFASTARAANLPRVLLLPYAPLYETVDPKVGEKTRQVLSNELKGSEQLELAELGAGAPVLAKSPGPARDDALLIEARERATKGQELLKKLSFKEAVGELEKAIDLYEKQHPYVEMSQLVDAYLDLAVAHYRLRQDEEGEKRLVQVVRLDPSRSLDAERYPPVFLRIFDGVARKVKGAPRVSIEVETPFPGSTIYLDGKVAGRAPMRINDVIRGAHFLKVVPQGGGEAWADRVDATTSDVKVTLASKPRAADPKPVQDLVAALGKNTIDASTIAKILALAAQARADYVVLGGVHQDGEQIVATSHLLQVATGKLCRLQRIAFDSEMVSATSEMYKLGADVTTKLDVFGEDQPLPAKVARDALPPKGHAIAPLVMRPPDPTDEPEESPEVRKIAATSTGPAVDLTGEPLAAPPDIKETESGPIWPWIVLGVVVVGGSAAGGYLYYDHVNQPTQGAATVRW